MPFLLLVILFVAVPIIEISLLLRVGAAIGVFNTIGFVIFTAVLGAYLVRQQGFATLNKVQQETNAGRVPAMPMAEGLALFFAGAVLLTPGFMSDAIGFALLVPPLRQGFIRWAANSFFKGRVHTQFGASTSPINPGSIKPDTSRGGVIEGEVISSTNKPR